MKGHGVHSLFRTFRLLNQFLFCGSSINTFRTHERIHECKVRLRNQIRHAISSIGRLKKKGFQQFSQLHFRSESNIEVSLHSFTQATHIVNMHLCHLYSCFFAHCSTLEKESGRNSRRYVVADHKIQIKKSSKKFPCKKLLRVVCWLKYKRGFHLKWKRRRSTLPHSSIHFHQMDKNKLGWNSIPSWLSAFNPILCTSHYFFWNQHYITFVSPLLSVSCGNIEQMRKRDIHFLKVSLFSHSFEYLPCYDDSTKSWSQRGIFAGILCGPEEWKTWGKVRKNMEVEVAGTHTLARE